METTENKLPENYWQIIEKYHPRYSSSQNVAISNDLTKFIEDDYEDEESKTEAIEDFKKEGIHTIKDAEDYQLELDTQLYNEAMEAKKEQE